MPNSETITYEQIFNVTSNGVVVTDAQGIVTHINRSGETILGISAKAHIGMFVLDMLPLTGKQVLSALETGNPILGHHIIGKKVDLILNITLIRHGAQVCGAVCNFQKMQDFELTAQKLESHRLLNRQLKAIFESSSDGIWVCDGKGTVINLNKASEKLNSIKAKDVLGKNVADIVKMGVVDRSVTLEVLKTRRQVSAMQYIKRSDRYLLTTGTPVFDENGSIFLVVINERDMTQLNAIREQLEQSRMVTEKFKDELAEISMLELKAEEMVAENEQMRQVLRVALKLARLEVSDILILGESGTGKTFLAKFIHKNSRRSRKPFIQINCAALPENLLEAELFGYEKGAFTGAREQGKAGLFELAHEGTLFLDEIGDMPLFLQAKLLKYLDDHEIMRLGGTRSRKTDCTVIAATNRDLETLVAEKRFRQDLYYRLNVFTLRIPPLRERPDDLFELLNYFLNKYNKTYQTRKQIRTKGLEILQSYSFPGNVRELKNIVKKAVVMSEGQILDEFIENMLAPMLNPGAEKTRATLPAPAVYPQRKRPLTEELAAKEKEILKHAMKRCRTTREIAAELGVSQPTVVRKMKRHGLGGGNNRDCL